MPLVKWIKYSNKILANQWSFLIKSHHELATKFATN